VDLTSVRLSSILESCMLFIFTFERFDVGARIFVALCVRRSVNLEHVV
jgi:hypothetical protein